ncbi:MAG: lipid-A-disaccharide synthase [Candidatus Omnitrophota bacterium]
MSGHLFIIACEASGDLHAARLVEEFRRLSPGTAFTGLGGPCMRQAGVTLLHDMTTLSALGLGDVLRQYLKYRKIFYATLGALQKKKPDALILVDSPAFNLRFAKKARTMLPSLPVLYYICPQLWAWGQRRIGLVKKVISKMYSILPFETEFYRQHGVDCEFVGHPLLDHLAEAPTRESARRKLALGPTETALGFFAGSRRSEVQRIFPIMVKTAALLKTAFPGTRLFYSESTNVPSAVYEAILKQTGGTLEKLNEDFDTGVRAMDFALVTSGTATLQTALLGTPFFLLYKASGSTYFIGRRLIQVPFIGLVNLLARKKVVPEFIQGHAKPAWIAEAAISFLKDPGAYERMKADFLKMRASLGEKGASETAARKIRDFLQA